MTPRAGDPAGGASGEAEPPRRATNDPQPAQVSYRALRRSPDFRRLLALALLAFTGFFVLLPVLPLWAVRGGSDAAGAGLVIATLLGATVVTQAALPRVGERFNTRTKLVAALLLLGSPAPMYSLSNQLSLSLALSVVRGIGFGLITVLGATLAASLVPAERWGEATGLYGLVINVPNVVGLPLGVVLVEYVNFDVVFWIAAVPLLGIPFAWSLGTRLDMRGTPSSSAPGGNSKTLTSKRRFGNLAMAQPSILLLIVALAAGGVVTVLPLVLPGTHLVSGSLFFLSGAAAVNRYVVGWISDRLGLWRLLVPALATCSLGMFAGWWSLTTGRYWLMIPAMVCFGVGYGAMQNLTLGLVFAEVGTEGLEKASAFWNVAFDSGLALGALGFGLIVSAWGPSGAFALSAIALALTAAVWAARR